MRQARISRAEQLDDFAQQGMEMFVEYMYEHFEEFKLR